MSETKFIKVCHKYIWNHRILPFIYKVTTINRQMVSHTWFANQMLIYQEKNHEGILSRFQVISSRLTDSTEITGQTHLFRYREIL
jgi:hypothetical protein